MRRILTAFLLLPLIAFSQASDWYMDFDEDFAAASVRRFYLVGAKATNPYAEAKREAARDEMVRYWVEVFRTNGIPEEFMERRRGVRPAVKDPDVIEVKENITPALKAR